MGPTPRRKFWRLLPPALLVAVAGSQAFVGWRSLSSEMVLAERQARERLRSLAGEGAARLMPHPSHSSSLFSPGFRPGASPIGPLN